jgi:phage terminase large subunit
MAKVQISAKQAEFIQSVAPRVLEVGARGSAKSAAIALSVCKDIAQNPGMPILCSRNDLADFKKTTLVEIKKFLPRSWILSHNRSEQRIEIRNGCVVYYPELKDESSVKSLNLGKAYLDEVDQISFESYSTLEGCLRWKRPDGTEPLYQMKMCCNPEVFWGRDIFRDGLLPDGKPVPESEKKNYQLIYSRCSDNPFLPKSFEAGLRARWPENWVRKYLDLHWESMSGAVFPEWDKVRIVNNDAMSGIQFPITGITLDHGRVHPTAVIFWKYNPYRPLLYVWAEYWKVGGYPDDHAPQIWATLLGQAPTIQIADSQIFADIGKDKHKRTIANEYEDLGFNFEPCGSKRMEEAQLTQVGMWMKNGWIAVHERCFHTIKEHREYHYNKLGKLPDEANETIDDLKYTISELERKQPPKDQTLTVESLKETERRQGWRPQDKSFGKESNIHKFWKG